MTKNQLFLVWFLFLSFLLNANGINIYKKGRVTLQPVLAFGSRIDWVEIFLNGYAGVAVAPDGSIFVSSVRRHCFYKFNSAGKLIGKYGQRGEGPGDLYSPGYLSILDNKYLVVGEYALRRRISLFDLVGKYIKVIKTNGSAFKPVALKNNKLAYAALQPSRGNLSDSSKWSVIIKDISTGKETVIESFEIAYKTMKLKGSQRRNFGNYVGDVYIKRTKNGNLLVGISNTPVIKIYSPDSHLIRTIDLKISPIAVTDEYISKLKQWLLTGIKENYSISDYLYYEKELKGASFKELFAEHLPFYRRIYVDSSGRILVFKWNVCFDSGIEALRIYNAEGNFICETRLTGNIFDYQVDDVDRNMVFTDKGIIGVFRLPDDDDESYKLMKVEYKY